MNNTNIINAYINLFDAILEEEEQIHRPSRGERRAKNYSHRGRCDNNRDRHLYKVCVSGKDMDRRHRREGKKLCASYDHEAEEYRDFVQEFRDFCADYGNWYMR